MKQLLTTAFTFLLLYSMAQANPAQIGRIFTHANLNVPYKKLERLAGKPVLVKSGFRHYQVGQCKVMADVSTTTRLLTVSY